MRIFIRSQTLEFVQYDSSRKQEMYIVELGGGTGKFCYYMMHALERMKAVLEFPIENIVYVLTDITYSVLSFWVNHPDL